MKATGGSGIYLEAALVEEVGALKKADKIIFVDVLRSWIENNAYNRDRNVLEYMGSIVDKIAGVL